MAPLIEQHRDRIIALCKQYGITRLDVFGSAARGTDFDAGTSDADFFYDIDVDAPALADRYFDFLFAMEDLLGRTVDLVTVDPPRPNPYFVAEANKSRITIYDIRRAGMEVGSLVEGLSQAALVGDRTRFAAALWNLSIIGEAMRRLTRDNPATAARITHADAIISFRNRIVHGYDEIKEAIVWSIVQTYLPALLREVEALLNTEQS